MKLPEGIAKEKLKGVVIIVILFQGMTTSHVLPYIQTQITYSTASHNYQMSFLAINLRLRIYPMKYPIKHPDKYPIKYSLLLSSFTHHH